MSEAGKHILQQKIVLQGIDSVGLNAYIVF